MLSSLAPARRRLVLGLLAVVVVALVASVIGYVLSRPAKVTPVDQDAQPPVLLVPGYGGGTAGLEVMAAALRAQGRQASVVHLAGDGTGDLDVQADVLDRAVRAALDQDDATSVDIVGYSAGGVTTRLWVRSHEGGSVARRIVTLGSPQHGSELAALGADLAPDKCPEACQQLAPASDLLRGLNAGDETPTGPSWVSIWTSDDSVSTPPETAVLDGALNFSVQSVCAGRQVTHGELPTDPAVIAMVEAELGRSATATPPSSVCADS